MFKLFYLQNYACYLITTYFKNMVHQNWIEDGFVYPTLGLSVISIFCNFYVIRSTLRYQIRLQIKFGRAGSYTHDYIVYSLIFWMSVIDTFYALATIVSDGTHWTHTSPFCVAVGFFTQLIDMYSSLWKLFITLYFFYLLIIDIKQQIPAQLQYESQTQKHNRNDCIFSTIHLIIIMLSLLGALLPLFWSQNNFKKYYGMLYNYTSKNNEHYAAECWLKGDFQFIFYGVLFVTILCDFIVLLLAIYKYNQTKSYTNAYLLLIKRLSAWVFVFWIVRIIPFIDRVFGLYYGENKWNPPIWLALGHNYMTASLGIANGLVWYFNKNIRPDPRSNLKTVGNYNNYNNYNVINGYVKGNIIDNNVNINNNQGKKSVHGPAQRQNDTYVNCNVMFGIQDRDASVTTDKSSQRTLSGRPIVWQSVKTQEV